MKYRVWDKKEKKYLEISRKFSFHLLPDGTPEVSSGWNSYKEPTFEDETDQSRYDIQTWTGFEDKNNIKIFKSDIVVFNGNKYIVVVINGCWSIVSDGVFRKLHDVLGAIYITSNTYEEGLK